MAFPQDYAAMMTMIEKLQQIPKVVGIDIGEKKYSGSKTRNYFTAYLLASIQGRQLRYLEKQQKILFAEENLEDKEIMNFKELLYRARQGDEDAILEIFEMYRPLLIKNALVDGIFDEDLYQELTAELLKCIRYFRDVE